MSGATKRSNFDKGEAVCVAILGAGFISEFHVRALKSLPHVSLIAVCDSEVNKARTLQQRWNIPHAYGSLRAMLESSKPDVVHILVPPPGHLEAALACIRAGCEVFVEKPLATSAVECLSLMDAARNLGRTVGVNHNAKFHPAFLRLIHEIQQCRLGQIQHVTACLNVPLRQLEEGEDTHWMFQRPGNIIFEQGPHPVSQIQHLLGDLKFVSVVPSGGIKLRTGMCFYQTWMISMICERGSAQCFLAFGRGYLDAWIHVIGEDGIAFVDLRRNTIRLSTKTRFIEPVDHLLDSLKTSALGVSQGTKNFTDYALAFVRLKPQSDPFFHSIRSSIAAFYNALLHGGRPPVDLEQGCAIVKACELIVDCSTPWLAESRIEPSSHAWRK